MKSYPHARAVNMKKIKLGINGFGRIGRLALRIASQRDNIEVVAINDLVPIEQLAYLLKYDSVHGTSDAIITVEGNSLVFNGKKIRVTAERDPKNLKWDAVNADVIAECTGIFKTLETVQFHRDAGAKKVVISAPSKDAPMFVLGVNDDKLQPTQHIVSNASCTTNALALVAKVLDKHYGIEEALMTTIHALTATQYTIDGASKKNYRLGRSGVLNIIPTTTGAAKAVGKVLPELDGKLTGMAFRVPTANASVVDLTVRLQKETSYDSICKLFETEAENDLKGFLKYTEDPIVSQDVIGETNTVVFDAGAGIELNSKFFKIVAWYDNEFGYSERLIDLAERVGRL